jgi:hypothetical protein
MPGKKPRFERHNKANGSVSPSEPFRLFIPRSIRAHPRTRPATVGAARTGVCSRADFLRVPALTKLGCAPGPAKP